jgi:hypothetical protein
MLTKQPDDIYVGYLPMPPGVKRFVRGAAVIVVLGFVGLAYFWVWTFSAPGEGRWDTHRIYEFEGVIGSTPYAMIRVLDETQPASVRTILLVDQGKRGGAEKLAGLDGRWAHVRGTVLERDNRRMVELAGPIEPSEPPSPALAEKLGKPLSAKLGEVHLWGEIVDPKCYLGAMKPGEGKTHKSCAALCITGGIPPVLVTRDPSGAAAFYLLTDPAGGPANSLVLPFLSDPVEITGELERHGDMLVLRIAPGAIRRL